MSIVLFTIFAIIIGVILHKLKKYYDMYQSVKHLPGPPLLPIIGNIHQLGFCPFDYVKNLFLFWKRYGPNPYRLWLLNQLFVIITDPKDIETILLSTPQLKKANLYDMLYPWLGEGLLTSSGAKWYKHRKIITPSFHFTILVDFFDTMNKVSSNFINKLNEKAKTEEVFDIQALVHYCTLDVICETAMGYNLDSINNPNSEVVTAFQRMCYLTLDRMFRPILANDFIYMLTPSYWEQKKWLRILKAFTSELIAKREKSLKDTNQNGAGSNNTNLKNGESKEKENGTESVGVQNGVQNGKQIVDEDIGIKKTKKVFLDTLLTSTIDGRPLTFEEVFEEVSTFMFEGHDTTTSGITFALYLLSRHPEVQKKVLEEQRSIFGTNLQRNATYQETLEMKYLEFVIKETQRLYPSVPMIGRQVTEKFNLNGIELAPGTTLTLFLIAMGYNEKNFPEPEKFIPERFDTTERDNTHTFNYVPFSAGPRNCIGQKFAILEMKCVLAKIVRNFEILPATENLPKFVGYTAGEKSDSPYELQISAVLTSKSDNGVFIRLRQR